MGDSLRLMLLDRDTASGPRLDGSAAVTVHNVRSLQEAALFLQQHSLEQVLVRVSDANVLAQASGASAPRAGVPVAEELDAIGRVVGRIGHDCNNLLTALFVFGTFVTRGLTPDSQSADDMQSAMQAAEKIKDLANQLLLFSQRQVVSPKVVNAADRIVATAETLRYRVGPAVDLTQSHAEDLWTIAIDVAAFDELVMNLCVNADEAMADGGLLTIETRNAVLTLDEADVHGLPPGEYVMLTVTDTGVGMSERLVRHIFEPFFTTKPKRSGVGLGLATGYGIVRRAHGAMWVRSEVGVGTTVSICLPRYVPKS